MTGLRPTKAPACAGRVLVVTTVHDPQDARILHRQIAAMLRAGWQVTYVAPWSRTDRPPPGVTAKPVPRSVGRHRVRACLAARKQLRREAPRHDLVLVHDLELVPIGLSVRASAPLVWDVHEDNVAALGDRPWLPRLARPLARRVVRLVEQVAERRCAGLLLAEHSYAARFKRPHAVVENLPWRRQSRAPRRSELRAVYVGRLSSGRGLDTLIEIGRRLLGQVEVVLVGSVDEADRGKLESAAGQGTVRWLGPQPNDRALEEVAGSCAGLALLRDLPNYRGSMPTKVLEYMASGVPVVTTPLPLAVEIVERSACGHVVDFDDAAAAASVILDLAQDHDAWERMSTAGYTMINDGLNWDQASERFLAELERLRVRHG